MPNSRNEFLVGRTIKGQFTINNGAKTTYTGLIIPKGAIITGARIVAPNAITITGASGTVQIAVGAVSIVATSNISTLAAQTVPRILTLATTGGNMLTANGELVIIEGTTANASATASYDVYVDYLYA
jgi:hypothetical protein